MRPDPEFLVTTLGNWKNWIAPQAGRIAFFAPENLERVPVKTVEPVAAGNPDKTLFILDNVARRIAWKPVWNLIIFEIIRRFLTQADQIKKHEAERKK